MAGVALFTFCAIYIPGLVEILKTKPASPLLGVLGTAVEVLLGLYWLRAAFLGVIITPEGIKVRKWFRTYRFPWTAIDSFYVASAPSAGPSSEAAWVRLMSGRTIYMPGLTGWARWVDPESASQVHSWIAELNDECAARIRNLATPA